jgi:hypothetical protein
MKTKATIWLVLVILVILIAAPAFALVEKSGFKDCGGNYVAVRSLATQVVRHYAPTGTQIGVWDNDEDFIVRNKTTLYFSTSWRVTSTGSLNDPGTYAWCYGS